MRSKVELTVAKSDRLTSLISPNATCRLRYRRTVAPAGKGADQFALDAGEFATAAQVGNNVAHHAIVKATGVGRLIQRPASLSALRYFKIDDRHPLTSH